MDLSNWSWDPSLFYVVPAAVLYALGSRPKAGRPSALEAAAFYTGLLSLVIAVDSPIDSYADQLLWIHMLQHIILLTVAPPLILLGRPWPTMWRALPRRPRASFAREVARSPARAVAKPLAAWILFNGAIIVWHIPSAYDLTERNGLVHACEHAMFFFFGLLFWARVIDNGPLRPRLQWPARIAYIVGAMIVGWVLAIVFVVEQHPIYQHYADLPSRPGGISALTDQQLAGGMMWVGGSVSFTIALLVCLYKWVAPEPPARTPVLDAGAFPVAPGGSPTGTNGASAPALPEVLQTR
ncbi:MAG TPA: cytochrome c oxidase assembly protein [Solirubrobacteraceae bacterium]|nr:cytochrome c oxidase assembly protein [Solirubrobacteraceae bacterium]